MCGQQCSSFLQTVCCSRKFSVANTEASTTADRHVQVSPCIHSPGCKCTQVCLSMHAAARSSLQALQLLCDGAMWRDLFLVVDAFNRPFERGAANSGPYRPRCWDTPVRFTLERSIGLWRRRFSMTPVTCAAGALGCVPKYSLTGEVRKPSLLRSFCCHMTDLYTFARKAWHE